MARRLKKKIVYTIEANLIFDADSNIDIEEYLEKLREIGVAEVVDVKLMDEDDLEEDED